MNESLKYQSTRGGEENLSFEEVLLSGCMRGFVVSLCMAIKLDGHMAMELLNFRVICLCAWMYGVMAMSWDNMELYSHMVIFEWLHSAQLCSHTTIHGCMVTRS